MISSEAYENLRNRLRAIAQLNRHIADSANAIKEPLKETSPELRSYADKMRNMAKALDDRAELLDVWTAHHEEMVKASEVAADKTSNVSLLGLNIQLLEEIIITTSSDKIRSVLEHADNPALKSAIVDLEHERLLLFKEMVDFALELYEEKYG